MVTRKLAFRVDHVVQNTRNLIDRKPLFPPLPGTDEIAFVDRSFYEAANHLIQLEQFKQEIIAITSHEFRTPLTSLLAKVDLIQVGVFGALNESGWTVARKARKNISFLIVLITNLLDLEKIQSGKTIVSKDSVSFDDVLRKAVQEVSELSEKRLPMIEVEENNITANVDAVRLAQSISAVLREMLEYSTEDTILKIDTQAKEKVVLVTITARGKECSQKALDRKTARGRLAVDLLRAIVEQHQGATEIKASDKQLEVKLEIPDS